MNREPWCIDPFINFAHTADGYYRPCCIGTVDRKNGQNIKNVSPLEYFTSDEMVQLRKEMFSREFSKHTKFLCKQCFDNEQEGVTSRREKENITYLGLDKTKNIIQKYNDSSYTGSVEDLIYVNFKILGNLCNLKCLMCGPSASSKIAAEWKKHNIFGHGILEKVERLPFDEASKQSYLQDLDKILKEIDRFSLVGGEAFINPNFDAIWDILSNNTNSSNIKLLIITNGTIIPQRVLEEAHKFNNLTLLFSIDGVGNRGNYVRSGLSWQNFNKNVRKALNSNATVCFTVATSMLNIGYLDEIYDYFKTLSLDNERIQWDAFVTDPMYLRAVNIPKKIKERYLKKLINHEISTLDKFIPIKNILESDVYNENEFLKGIAFLKKTDIIRNTNLLKHFPEFEEYYINVQI